MSRKNFRTLFIVIPYGLLMAAAWTHGVTADWLIRGAIGALGGMLLVDVSWRRERQSKAHTMNEWLEEQRKK